MGQAQRLVVVINPASGSTTPGYREAIEAALRQRGADYEVRETTPALNGEAVVEAAVCEGAGQVLVCGGDGTVMAAVNGLWRAARACDAEVAPAALSIVPGGTANLVATALRIPSDPAGAVAVALDGIERRIDLGRCGERVFALGVGVGMTERFVSQASAIGKERWGRLAYLFAMIRELGARPDVFTLRLDDNQPRRESGVAVVIANSGDIGYGLSYAPFARMDDGLLDVCILRRFYLGDALRMAWRLVTGGLPGDRALTFYQARRIELGSRPPLDAQLDGEPVSARTPLVAEVESRALRVRVPRE